MIAADEMQVFGEVTDMEVRRAGDRRLILTWKTATEGLSMAMDRETALSLASCLAAAASTLPKEGSQS